MKLVICIVQDDDSDELERAFVEENIRVTRLASTGGFLQRKNTTFLIGIEEKKLEQVIDIIAETSSTRETIMPQPGAYEFSIEYFATEPIKVQVGGAIVFVVELEDFYKL